MFWSCLIVLLCFNFSCFCCVTNTKMQRVQTSSLRRRGSWGRFSENLPVTGGRPGATCSVPAAAAWTRGRVGSPTPSRHFRPPTPPPVATHPPCSPKVPPRGGLKCPTTFPLLVSAQRRGPQRRLGSTGRSTCLFSRPRHPGGNSRRVSTSPVAGPPPTCVSRRRSF